VATAQHLTDLAVDLAAAGHEVTVLTGRRGYAEPHPIYPKKDVYQGVQVVRVWPFSLGRKNKTLRILNALCINLVFAAKLLSFGRYDRILVLTSPPLIAFVAALFAKFRKIKLDCWMMDLNPDEAIQAGWIRANSISARFLEWALKFVLRECHGVVVLDRFMKKRIVQKGCNAEKVEIIPPWAHSMDFAAIQAEDNPFRKQHHLQGKFVIMYAGNHSICHPLDTLLEAALGLRNEQDIVFMFIGGGARVKDVLNFQQTHQLSNIVYLPYVKREELKYTLFAADLHVIVMGERFVGIVHPCKIYGILAAGRPFIYIGPPESHIGDILKEENNGFHVNHTQAALMMDLIKKAKSDKKTQDGTNPCSTAFEKYSRTILCRRLMEYLRS